MTTTNIDAAIKAVNAEYGSEVPAEYLAKCADLAAAVQALMLPHAKAIRNAASRASRAKRAARV